MTSGDTPSFSVRITCISFRRVSRRVFSRFGNVSFLRVCQHPACDTMTVSNSTMTPQTTTKSHKIYNLILPISLERRKVLLGYKRRGFGVGKFNGFGGKVEPGETIVASAKRELEEESGIICSEDQLHHHAVLLLETVAPGAEQEKILEIHVFVCTEWTGEIVEYVF